jgi:hypothetical protein
LRVTSGTCTTRSSVSEATLIERALVVDPTNPPAGLFMSYTVTGVVTQLIKVSPLSILLLAKVPSAKCQNPNTILPSPEVDRH